jgi:ABC-type glycerol-3-phosphate transport system permease component
MTKTTRSTQRNIFSSFVQFFLSGTETTKHTTKTVTALCARYFFLILIGLVVSLPFISMIGVSLKEARFALGSSALFPPLYRISFESFDIVINRTTFPFRMLNSFIVSSITVVIVIVIATSAGYAISRFQGKYFSFYALMLLVIQMIPPMLLLIPLYQIYVNLGLINTLSSVIITYSTIYLAFAVWMLKGFFDTIPRELEQAAMVDGCSQFYAFLKIILPLSLPGIATVAIFTFINAWNEFTYASIFLRREAVMTVSIGLQRFILQFAADWTLLKAAATLATIPSVIFLFFCQKYLIEGMTAGAVKG